MNRKEREECDKQCRAPFTDAGGNCTLPKHRPASEKLCEDISDIITSLPEEHRQDFIRLVRKIFGLKLITVDEKIVKDT